MEPIRTVTGVAATLERQNVDTDAIIPKQFLKRIERTGYGPYCFFDWRYFEDGVTLNPDFEINRPEYLGAPILVTGKNFGSGSSREHAPWALGEMGFRVIIAPAFADIFFNNCLQNGILLITLPEDINDTLLHKAQKNAGKPITVDLEQQTITDHDGEVIPFEIDQFRKFRLLNGLDDIGLTLQHEDKITDYETRRPAYVTLGK